MSDFLSDLFLHYLEEEPRSHDTRYQKEEALREVKEEQIRAVMGEEFWEQYAKTAFRCAHWENLDAFRMGVRLGVELMREIEARP